MSESRVNSKQNVNIELPGPSTKQKRFLVGIVAVALVISLLAFGFFFAPQLTVYGLSLIGIGIPLLLLIWYRTEFGLLALIFLTSSLIPTTLVDIRLPIGGGFDLRDLVFIGLFGIVIVRELSRKKLNFPWWKVSGPLVLFLAMVIFSTIYAITIRKVELNWALSDARILMMYAVFFIVMWSIKNVNQLNVLLIGLFIIADLTSLIVIVQQFVGANNPLLQAMLTTRDWRVDPIAGGVRVVPAGQVLMHFMWFIAFGILFFAPLNRRAKIFIIFQIVYLGIGHLFTYMRAQWVAMFIGFVIMCLIVAPRYKFKLPRFALLGLSILLLMALLWGTLGIANQFNGLYRIPLVAGIADRFNSLLTPDDTLETQSLQWRLFENSKAMESIAKYPILGVGLGGRYREITTFHGEADGRVTHGSLLAGEVSRFTRYAHNSYFSIGAKMGIPGLLMLLWFCLSFLLNGWKVYQNTTDLQLKGVILGVLTGFIGVMEWSYYHAHLIKAESAPVIALMAGIVGVIAYNKMGMTKTNTPTEE